MFQWNTDIMLMLAACIGNFERNLIFMNGVRIIELRNKEKSLYA